MSQENSAEPDGVVPGTVDAPTGPRWTAHMQSWGALIVALVVAVIFLVEAISMRVGSLSEPGPALWPMIVASALIATCIAGFFVDLRSGEEPFERSGFTKVVAGAVALYLFVVLFTYTGTIIAGFAFLTIWLRFLTRESWRLSLSVAVIASFAAYFLFVGALGVVFPPDLVASLWGGR